MGKKFWIAVIVIVILIAAYWWWAKMHPPATVGQANTSGQTALSPKATDTAAIMAALKGINETDIKKELQNINSGQ